MLITISGAQGVGKSTLIKELIKRGWYSPPSIARELKKRGHGINRDGNDNTQIRVLEEHINRAKKYLNSNEDVVLDRSIIDGMVYTKYLYDHQRVSLSTLHKFENATNIYINYYDKIFYIPPEFDIIPDGYRDGDREFRNKIVDIFDYYIDKYNIDVIKLRGSVEDRLNSLYDNIEKTDIRGI